MSNARKVIFATSPDLTTWTQTKSGAGTITISGANNRRATLTNDGTRTFFTKNVAITAGCWYWFSVDVISAAAGFDTDSYGDAHLLIYNVESIADGDQFYAITAADDGTRRGILFKSAVTKTEGFRIGIGAAGNREAGELVIENVQIIEYGPDAPTHVDRYYDVNGGTFPISVYTDKVAASTYTAGVTVQAAPTQRLSLHNNAIALFIGDSYGMNDRYPLYVQRSFARLLSGKTCEYYNHHIGGEDIFEIGARLHAALTGSALPIDLAELWTKPSVAVLEGGGNSILSDDTAATVLGGMDDMIDICRANGVSRIVIVNLPPFKNYSSYTVGRATQGLAYNALLADKYRGLPVFDLYAAVRGDVNTDALSKIANGDTWDYDSGDGLHPTAAASEMIGRQIAMMLVHYPVASKASGLTSPLTSSLVSR